MTYVKRRSSAESLLVGAAEGRYRTARPDTETRNTGSEAGDALTAQTRQGLNTLNGYGAGEQAPKLVPGTLGKTV